MASIRMRIFLAAVQKVRYLRGGERVDENIFDETVFLTFSTFIDIMV